MMCECRRSLWLWSLLIALQIFQLLFLLLHDWVQLGSLNNVSAFQKSTTLPQKVASLLIPSIPVMIGLGFTLLANTRGPSLSFRIIFSAVYGFLLLGELEAWWIPYAFGTSAERVALYRTLFAGTHSFLPSRHGITPNTLHVALHAATVATLILVWIV
jgi:hypothetical protein